jgi:hypothetical protein
MADVTITPKIRCDNCGLAVEKETSLGVEYLSAAGYRIVGPGEVRALDMAVFKLVADAYGLRIAADLEASKWEWPESAPRYVSPTIYAAVAAIRALSKEPKAQGGDDGAE